MHIFSPNRMGIEGSCQQKQGELSWWWKPCQIFAGFERGFRNLDTRDSPIYLGAVRGGAASKSAAESCLAQLSGIFAWYLPSSPKQVKGKNFSSTAVIM
jgi:hypothetical protein